MAVSQGWSRETSCSMPYHTKNSTILFFIENKKMHGSKKVSSEAFLKMRPPEYFFRFWSLSLPQKVKIFMANRENSYGADVPQA